MPVLEGKVCPQSFWTGARTIVQIIWSNSSCCRCDIFITSTIFDLEKSITTFGVAAQNFWLFSRQLPVLFVCGHSYKMMKHLTLKKAKFVSSVVHLVRLLPHGQRTFVFEQLSSFLNSLLFLLRTKSGSIIAHVLPEPIVGKSESLIVRESSQSWLSLYRSRLLYIVERWNGFKTLQASLYDRNSLKVWADSTQLT